jgi:hypothetical protein
MADKRKIITQLPAVHQTETLKGFFSATADHLFQPGLSEPISGYIGQKPVYYDPSKDFYIEEPTDTRQAYQLEPAMVSVDNTGTYANTLCYDDLINYLNSQGANTTNHSRLFEGEYYSWAPPVDLDKLNNFSQYVWMGVLSTEENALTSIKLSAPHYTFYFDPIINAAGEFLVPGEQPEFPGKYNPVVLVNGEPVSANYQTRTDLNPAGYYATINVSGLVVGDIVETYRYGDLKTTITGSETLPLTFLIAWKADGHAYAVGDLVYVTGVGPRRCVIAHTSGATFDETQWVIAAEADYLTTGSRVMFDDANNSATTYLTEGVGTFIQFSDDHSSDEGGETPRYIVIDRRSLEQSPWARRNLWIHKSALEWTGLDFAARKAKRPIIEFLPNIEMWNYGWNRLPDVQATLTSTQATVFDNWDIYPWDNNVWDKEKVNLSAINGKLFGTMDGKVIGSVLVDNNYILQPNDLMFVNQTVTNEPEINNMIYRVISNTGTPLPSGATADVVELIQFAEIKRGDIFRIERAAQADRPTSVFEDQEEYWYDGEKWILVDSSQMNPLFNLFDASTNGLGDVASYPGTDFNGSELFSYQIGTGANDPYLGFPITVNAYSQPIFEVDPIVYRVTYDAGEIIGYYYHHFLPSTGQVEGYSNNWFTVDEPSSQTLTANVYSIPLNLSANPTNDEVSYISRNQWFDHFSSIMLSQDGFTGHPYTVNNWRDTDKFLGNGDKILQHRSPMLKTMLVSSNSNYDVLASIRYVQSEYTRFRNKFKQAIIDFYKNGTMRVDIDADGNGQTVWINTPDEWVQAILEKLRLNKASDFPFALSEMAGDQFFIPPTPASLGIGRVTAPMIFEDTSFVPSQIMLQGHDNSVTPTDGDFRDDIMLALETRIYDNINASFKTEELPILYIEGYVAGKFRTAPTNGYTYAETQAMLTPFLESWSQAAGLNYRSRDIDTEIVNSQFAPDDPLTWNYRAVGDRDAQPIPGNWKGIYRFYFDTYRPHIAPWEMVGFSEKPIWWDTEYGVAPYTRGNTKLWDHMEHGFVAQGPRAGFDARFVRPNLMDYLPIDNVGELLNPIDARIVTDVPTYQQASADWVAGDEGPVENLWKISSTFQYDLSKLSFLMKPSRFMEECWDTVDIVKDASGQWIYEPTGNRPRSEQNTVHGETAPDGSRYVKTGVQQWIVDYMAYRGQPASNFGDSIRGLDVRLAHKMAGYTSLDNLKVLADNFGLVPTDDIEIVLYRSPSIREEFYSGILIEWTGAGWKVIGYDGRNPNFTVIPGMKSGPKGYISLSATPEPSINEWKPNTYYTVGVLVSHNSSVYRVVKSHTSGSTFEQVYYLSDGTLYPQAPRVVTYLRAEDYTESVPYGTILYSQQEVADFLLGHERYMVSKGWRFEQTEGDDNVTQDWTKAVEDFLAWSQVDWAPGNFITVSPGADLLKIIVDQGIVMDILNSPTGSYGMINRTGNPIDRRNVVVNRVDEEVTILSKLADVYGTRVNIQEIEHALFFSNKTIFGDIIYEPLFDLRQPRLRLIGNRSTDWNGRLDAPGFILIDNQIKSNYEKSSTDLSLMFDIEKADNAVLRDHARHAIGYDSRSYLSELVLSDVEQFEFYQGLIHQKGAPGAFDKLLRSNFIEQSRDLKFFEEWAFRIGNFGAPQRERLAFMLGSSQIKRDPQLIRFTTGNSTTLPTWYDLNDANSSVDGNWVERPKTPSTIFPQRADYVALENDLPMGGYIRTNEANYTVFAWSDVPALYVEDTTTLEEGEVIWVHQGEDLHWDALKIRNMSNTGSNNTMIRVDTATEDEEVVGARIYMEADHGLMGNVGAFIGAYVVIDGQTGTTPDLIGVQTISNVGHVVVDNAVTNTEETIGWWFEVPVFPDTGYDFLNQETPETGPEVRIMRSMHYVSNSAFLAERETYNPAEGDIAYVDGPTWGVYLRNGPTVSDWTVARQQPKRMDNEKIASTLVYDLKTSLSTTSLMPEPIRLNYLTVLSPAVGLIPGTAEREIDFRIEYDPAQYVGIDGQWDNSEVGRVWWNTSTVRFIESETDLTSNISDDRLKSELTYRSTTWGKIAPATSVDIYEWFKSDVAPADWLDAQASDPQKYSGTIFNAEDPAWTETVEYDSQLERNVTKYFFWVKGRTITPAVDFRKLDVNTVARILANPIAQDLAWVAPVAPNALLVGGVSPFVTDPLLPVSNVASTSGTVFQLELDNPEEDDVTHDQWLMLRPEDERSIPPDWLWNKMRDSLVGFDDRGNVVPKPYQPPQ